MYRLLLLPLLLLLASTCQKHSLMATATAMATEPQEHQQQEPHSPAAEATVRSARQAGNNKEFNGGGVYWIAADGPDFQLWQPSGSAYGTAQQQQQTMAAMQAGNGQQQQVAQQAQVAMAANGGQPMPSMSSGQQPMQQMAAAAAQQLQQQQATTAQQQMMPQQSFQQSMMGGANFPGYGQLGGGGQQGGGGLSPYAAYLEKQISSYPVMIYTLADCIPCQRAKHMLAVHYPDVRAHYLELSGNEPWQQQLQVDLQYLTGAITFPYIFVCGQYIGGSTELFELHETGQLRRLVSQCLQKPPPK